MATTETNALRAGGEPPRIAVRGLRKSFDGRPVLRGVDLEVFRGESVAILGASGGGKSVLLKHVIGLLRPDDGTVEIDGRDMSGAGEREWRDARRLFGMAFQEGALFDSLDVFENVAFPLRRHTKMKEPEIRARVRECLDIVQLPQGVESKATNQLSGGMRRRVGFARAIAAQPEILLFDEPNTGLDPITSAVIDLDIQLMRERLPVTVVTITHDVRSVFRIATRIAMLRDGKILAAAPPEEFRRLPDPYIQKFLAGEPPEEEDR